MDGVDIRTATLHSVRRNVSMVLQDVSCSAAQSQRTSLTGA